jgi:hypothetical protein
MIKDGKVTKKFAGAYLIDGTLDGTQLVVTKAPNKLRRFFFRLLLGWKWASVADMKRTNKEK